MVVCRKNTPSSMLSRSTSWSVAAGSSARACKEGAECRGGSVDGNLILTAGVAVDVSAGHSGATRALRRPRRARLFPSRLRGPLAASLSGATGESEEFSGKGCGLLPARLWRLRVSVLLAGCSPRLG